MTATLAPFYTRSDIANRHLASARAGLAVVVRPWPTGQRFRYAQREFANASWEIVPALDDAKLAARGFRLASEHRDGGALTPDEFRELVALNRAPRDGENKARESALLERCPFGVAIPHADFDVCPKVPGYDPATAPALAASFAAKLTPILVAIGLGEPLWSLTNTRGGLHGDFPDIPIECTSPLLTKAIGEAVRAAAEGVGIPCSESAASAQVDRTHPVILDVGNFNRATTGKGSMRRFMGTRKADADSCPKTPVVAFTATRPELAPLAPSPTRAKPDAGKILAMIQAFAASEAKRPVYTGEDFTAGGATVAPGTVALTRVAATFNRLVGAGARHKARLALVGWLARTGVSVALCTGTIALISPDDTSVVASTFERLAAKLPVAGWPALARMIGGDMEPFHAALLADGISVPLVEAEATERRLVVVKPRGVPKLTGTDRAVYGEAESLLEPKPHEAYLGRKKGWGTVYPKGYAALEAAETCRCTYSKDSCTDHGDKGSHPHRCKRAYFCRNCSHVYADRWEAEVTETWKHHETVALWTLTLDHDAMEPKDHMTELRKLERAMAACAPGGSRARRTLKGFDSVTLIMDVRPRSIDEEAAEAMLSKLPVGQKLMKAKRRVEMSRYCDAEIAHFNAEKNGLAFNVEVLPLAETIAKLKTIILSINDRFMEHVARGDARAMATFPWLLKSGTKRTCSSKKAREVFPWPSQESMAARALAALLEKRHGVPLNECDSVIGTKDGLPCYCRKVLHRDLIDAETGESLAPTKTSGIDFRYDETISAYKRGMVTVGSDSARE